MMLQYVCLFPLLRESWLALLFLQPGDVVLAYAQFSVSTLLFLSYVIVHTVFRRGVFRKREALNDSRAVTAENSMIRRREDSEHTDEGAASGAVLGEERTADIHAFAEQVRRLQSEADRDALFTQCVGRLPYGPERNRLTGGVVVQDELCAACATTAASLWRRAVLLLRHLLYLVYYPTVLLALLLGGTWTTTTDLLHALLLALLVVYFVKPDWIIVRPHLASLSVASVGLVLVVYNYVLAFLPEEPEYLPGTSIPLSVLGLKKLSHRWDAWFYFLGFISLTVLQRVVNGQCLSWGAVLRRKELREFQNSSLLQSWVPWATATLALVSAAVTAAVSFHSMFVSGFLLGTLSLLVTVSYGNARVIRVCRLVCGVYGVIIAFVTTVSQLPFVRASLLAWVEAYLPYCGDALSAVQCGKEIGFLTHPNTGWLLPQLAPWYITTGLVLSVHPLTFRVIPTEKFARDMPLQRALSFVFKTTEYYCGGLVMFLAYGSIFLSWVSLSFPAREDVCVLHLVYLVLFLFDAAPCVVWPYAYLHCAVLFVYQLRWVPAIPFAIPYGTEGNTLPLSTLLGLQKQEGDTSALVTAGWPIAVLLLTLIRRTLFSKRNHQLLSVVSVCLLFGGI
ncbi:hypothetical protein AGDE_15388 [Angomonas deanei]|nr:hypothetical protein AGDE_15388 [Angomonas deanei]|eukprot:EPY19172.1 hypothetical protein AGDE_15388 [Angomonas deanei]